MSIEQVILAEREACAKCVPSNWLDPLLTGPKKVIPDGVDCPTVERLLNAIRERILARTALPSTERAP